MEGLLTLFLTKLKITFSINQPLHDGLLTFVFEPASRCHGNRRGRSGRENCPGDEEGACGLRIPAPELHSWGGDRRARVSKESMQWELCTVIASNFSIS